MRLKLSPIARDEQYTYRVQDRGIQKLAIFLATRSQKYSERTKSDAKEFWISLNNGLCSWNSRDPMYFCSLIPNHPTWRRVKMQPWEVMAKKLNWSRDQSKLLFLDDCFRANGVHGHFIASDTLETIYLWNLSRVTAPERLCSSESCKNQNHVTLPWRLI